MTFLFLASGVMCQKCHMLSFHFLFSYQALFFQATSNLDQNAFSDLFDCFINNSYEIQFFMHQMDYHYSEKIHQALKSGYWLRKPCSFKFSIIKQASTTCLDLYTKKTETIQDFIAVLSGSSVLIFHMVIWLNNEGRIIQWLKSLLLLREKCPCDIISCSDLKASSCLLDCNRVIDRILSEAWI